MKIRRNLSKSTGESNAIIKNLSMLSNGNFKKNNNS